MPSLVCDKLLMFILGLLLVCVRCVVWVGVHILIEKNLDLELHVFLNLVREYDDIFDCGCY